MFYSDEELDVIAEFINSISEDYRITDEQYESINKAFIEVSGYDEETQTFTDTSVVLSSLYPELPERVELVCNMTTMTKSEYNDNREEDLLYELESDIVPEIINRLEEEKVDFPILSDVEKSERRKRIDLTQAYLPFPHMRKRRKQWAGKPTFRTYELNTKTSYGYAKRSMLRHFPSLSTFDWKRTVERTKRSLSHTYLWKYANMTTFETLNTRFDEDLFSAFRDLGFKHMQDEMYTDNMRDAWQTYMSEGVFEEFLRDEYAPSIIAFSELGSKIKEFIANEWDKYSKEARIEREGRYDMHLTREQIDNLQDADLSYL